MKRKNLIAKRKVDSSLIKNNFQTFKKILFKNLNKKSFAVAVSGGADSLCLAYFSKMYSSEFKNKIVILIVNHNIRKESSKEALKVKRILEKKGISGKILSWKKEIPSSNIQLKARNIRYSLMSNYCSKNNIKYLITAHHIDDQIENFFIRLFRGSGLTGLSSMTENTKYDENLKILRPLLNCKKEDLRQITLKHFGTYISDPSNKNEKFLRVRIRKYRNIMKEEGLDSRKIIKTINNLYSANKALNFYKNKALFKYTSFLSKNRCIVNKKIFSEEANEIIFKSFSDILSLISRSYYPPRSKKILRLISEMKKSTFKKSTLGGCIIEKKQSFISFSKESKVRKIAHQLEK
mgnify:FL=1|tara:strand:- start:989 stop:2038 length:1050 start_codon:yes stop_codon:yes gene_type:complete